MQQSMRQSLYRAPGGARNPGVDDVNQDQACYYMITGIIGMVVLVLILF